MIEILKDSSERVSISLNSGGVGVEADGAVVADIESLPEGTVVRTFTATHDTLNVGTYYFDWPLSLADEDGEFRVRWSFAVGGESITKLDYVSIVTPYATPGDIERTFPNLADKPYAEIVAKERLARSIIDEYCGQRFTKWHGTVRVVGGGSNVLLLNQRILSLDPFGISVNGTAIDTVAAGVYTDSAGRIVAHPASGMWGVKPDLWDYSGGFFKDNYVYEVTGWFGWEGVPADVSLATAMLVNDYYCTDNAWRQKGVETITASDWRLQMHDRAFTGTGNMDVDRLLNKYVYMSVAII